MPPPADAAPARYELGAEIARGGMGTVHRATDLTLGREVAVKLLRPPAGPGAARRFVAEARITAQLQHPAIPAVHDLGTLPDGRPFLAMKLIKGDTLDELLKRRPDPADDRGRFVAAFEAVCQAVGYAHFHGVVHRDLKPLNVMVGVFGEVQVTDWGLAKVLGDAGPTAADPDATAPLTAVVGSGDGGDDATRDGSMLGTPAYMPPEQAIGAVDQIDRRSDVFGLGGILAAILTGKPPFVGDTAESTRQLAAKGRVGDCFARLDGCGADPELVALCKRCLAAEKADRPADAADVAGAVAALRAAADERARQAERDRVAAEVAAAEQRKRRRVQLGLAAALVLLVAGVGAGATWHAYDAGERKSADERRDGEARDRRTAAAGAAAALLDRCEAALRAGDAAQAAGFLDAARRRAADAGPDAHAARLAGYARDLAVLRELDAADHFRWEPDRSMFPGPIPVGQKYAAALAGFGITPGPDTPADTLARLAASPIRAAVLGALDTWLAGGEPTPLPLALLAAADPDPFRTDVRRMVAATDRAGLTALAARAEVADQPPGLMLAWAAIVPDPVVVPLLKRYVATAPADFGVYMTLGLSYPAGVPTEAADRGRWFQAAVALRPRHRAARLNLGMSLIDQNNPDALAELREVVRVAPDYPPAHQAIGVYFEQARDPTAAAAAFAEAIRCDPNDPKPRHGLGNARLARGDPAGAEASFREAVRLDPINARHRYGLGNALGQQKRFADAEREFREAIRLNPRHADAHSRLGDVLRIVDRPDAAEAAYREALKLNPNHGPALAGLRALGRGGPPPVPAARP